MRTYATFLSRPTWINTGMYKPAHHLNDRQYSTGPVLRLGKVFARPTWIMTGSYEPSVDRRYSRTSGVSGNLDDKRTGCPDGGPLRSATAVIALKMALARFKGDERIYPRR